MGYELNRFEGDVDEELICPICSGVLEEPLQVHKLKSIAPTTQTFHYLDFIFGLNSWVIIGAFFIITFKGSSVWACILCGLHTGMVDKTAYMSSGQEPNHPQPTETGAPHP